MARLSIWGHRDTRKSQSTWLGKGLGRLLKEQSETVRLSRGPAEAVCSAATVPFVVQ